jgi:hypothetical protein
MPRESCRASQPLVVAPPLFRQAMVPLASSVTGKPDDSGYMARVSSFLEKEYYLSRHDAPHLERFRDSSWIGPRRGQDVAS